MNSRDYILQRAKANKPDAITLPTIDSSVFDDARNLLDEFTLKVEAAGGSVYNATSNDNVLSQVKTKFPEGKTNFSTLKTSEDFNTIAIEAIKKPHDLEDLDVLVLEGTFGVAENGAIWVNDAQLPMRILPFITKHLVLVIKKEAIVTFMHQAYQKLNSSETDFGVFISGPSKTADIEQSLVIGAHGALSLTVFLV